MGVSPNVFFFSILNHPAIGLPPFMVRLKMGDTQLKHEASWTWCFALEKIRGYPAVILLLCFLDCADLLFGFSFFCICLGFFQVDS